MERNPNLNLKIILRDILWRIICVTTETQWTWQDQLYPIRNSFLLSHIPTPVVVDPISTIPVFIFHLTKHSNSPHLTFNTTESMVTFNLELCEDNRCKISANGNKQQWTKETSLPFSGKFNSKANLKDRHDIVLCLYQSLTSTRNWTLLFKIKKRQISR